MRGKTLKSSRDANQAALEVRRLRRRIAAAEQKAEDAAARARERMVQQTAALRDQEEAVTGKLREFFHRNRSVGQKSMKLQDATIGFRMRQRIEVPKSAIDAVPPEALSVRKTVNKTALKALGEEAMAAVGAKVVRPVHFFVEPADEDGDK